MKKKTETSGFRHHEFLDGSFLEDLKDSLEEDNNTKWRGAFQFQENILWLKAAKRILKWSKYLIKKGVHGGFFNKRCFRGLPLENVLDPTEPETLLKGFCRYLEKTDDISFENMKKAVVYGSVMASFTVEEFGTKKLEEIKEDYVSCRIKNITELVNSGV